MGASGSSACSTTEGFRQSGPGDLLGLRSLNIVTISLSWSVGYNTKELGYDPFKIWGNFVWVYGILQARLVPMFTK